MAARPFRFNPAAEAELVEAAAWYEARRAGLAGEFVRAFRARIDGILEAPDRWPLSAGVRRALLGKFPYTIVYRVIEEDAVEVVAVAHVKRRPKYKAQGPYTAQTSDKPPALAPGNQERAQSDRMRYAIVRALAVPVDPAQLETHTFQVSQEGARCSIFGADAICARLLDGPFLLRDWIAMPGCPDQLLVGSSLVNEVLDARLRVRPSGLVPATNTGAYGAHLFVPARERLIVAVRPTGPEVVR